MMNKWNGIRLVILAGLTHNSSALDTSAILRQIKTNTRQKYEYLQLKHKLDIAKKTRTMKPITVACVGVGLFSSLFIGSLVHAIRYETLPHWERHNNPLPAITGGITFLGGVAFTAALTWYIRKRVRTQILREIAPRAKKLKILRRSLYD